MSYIQGFLVPVPIKNKEAYRDLAEKTAPFFKKYCAIRIVETWGDSVPDGKVTDFKKAVKVKEDETVVFSWTEWPDKATYESAVKKMEDDMNGEEMPEMPFDGKRMMWAGFVPIFDTES